MFYDKIGSVYNYDTLKGTNLDVIIFLKEKTLQVEASLKHRIVSFNYKILATPTKKNRISEGCLSPIENYLLSAKCCLKKSLMKSVH